MKNIRFLTLITFLVAFTFLSGCKEAKPTTSKPPKQDNSLTIYDTFFPQNKNLKYIYNGYAEYSFYVSFQSKDPVNNGFEYVYNGVIQDGKGTDPKKGDRTFTVKYEVGQNKIIEHINSKDYFSKSTETLKSLIPNYIIVLGEIKEGSQWKQPFIFDDKTIDGTTTIVKATTNSFTLQTIAKDPVLENGEYKEERTYEVGKGLTSFTSSLEDFLGYSLSRIDAIK